jgi:O-acetyl-ADP-ribose deacetylase (regulator of RNase III)
MSIVISDQGAASNPYLNRIKIVLGDISDQEVDCIAGLLPPNLAIDGAINSSILARAGNDLDEFILEHIYQPKPGDVYAVPGFNLPCRNILFAIRPKWKSDFEREDKHLVMSVRKIMVLAKCMLQTRIAFPPLASGKNGFAKQRAARLLIQGIADRLDEPISEVRIVCPDAETLGIYTERLNAFKGRV